MLPYAIILNLPAISAKIICITVELLLEQPSPVKPPFQEAGACSAVILPAKCCFREQAKVWKCWHSNPVWDLCRLVSMFMQRSGERCCGLFMQLKWAQQG